MDLFCLTKDNWTTIASVAAAASATMAAAALLVNARSVRQGRLTREISQMFYDLRAQERDLLELKASAAAGENANIQAKVEAWSATLFQTMEYLAFLHKEIQNKRLLQYFEDCVMTWYEQVFLPLAPERDRTDPKQYREFKALYDQLKAERLGE
ncbi:MAG: hypothetical protein NTW68_00320 [candidate division NC10 bacterium]|nr:hypothetical protein [candidate division NC10 bacterium]